MHKFCTSLSFQALELDINDPVFNLHAPGANLVKCHSKMSSKIFFNRIKHLDWNYLGSLSFGTQLAQ